jgi:hypothetical protein
VEFVIILPTHDLFLLNMYCSRDSPHLSSIVSSSGKPANTPLVQCTSHMCPIRVHWHVKLNYKEYWRIKITITNFNYRMNYSQWNLVVQHPNFDNLTQLFSFKYKSLNPYEGLSKFYTFIRLKHILDLIIYHLFHFVSKLSLIFLYFGPHYFVFLQMILVCCGG